MEITKQDWDMIVKAIENAGYTISKSFFDLEDEDSCEIIASNPQWSIRVKYDWDNIQLNLDDTSESFGSYFVPVERMDAQLFVLCIDNILAMLPNRYK